MGDSPMGSLNRVQESDIEAIEDTLRNLDPLIEKVEGMVAKTTSETTCTVIESVMTPVKPFASLERVTPDQTLANQPNLEVGLVNGQTPGRVYALMDTGAKSTCISTGMLKACGITQKLSEHRGVFNVVGGGKLPLAGACTLSLQLGDYCVLKLSNVVVVDQDAPTMLIGTDLMLGQGAHLSPFRIYLDRSLITFACSATGSQFNRLYLSYEYGKSPQPLESATPVNADKFLPADKQKSLTESELALPRDLLLKL